VRGKYRSDRWFEPEYEDYGEWPVSYHGLKCPHTIRDIIHYGYDISRSVRSKYGRGIYSSPYPEVAEEYAEAFRYQGKWIKVMLMNRVHMNCTNIVHGKRYFVTMNEEQIRPIAVLLKRVY